MSEDRVLVSRRSFLALCGAAGASLVLPDVEKAVAALPEEVVVPKTAFPGNVRVLVDGTWHTIGYLGECSLDEDPVCIDYDHIGLPRYRGIGRNKTCSGTVLVSDRHPLIYGVARNLVDRGESFSMEIDVNLPMSSSMVVRMQAFIKRIEVSVGNLWDEDVERHPKIEFVTTGPVQLVYGEHR